MELLSLEGLSDVSIHHCWVSRVLRRLHHLPTLAFTLFDLLLTARHLARLLKLKVLLVDQVDVPDLLLTALEVSKVLRRR